MAIRADMKAQIIRLYTFLYRIFLYIKWDRNHLFSGINLNLTMVFTLILRIITIPIDKNTLINISECLRVTLYIVYPRMTIFSSFYVSRDLTLGNYQNIIFLCNILKIFQYVAGYRFARKNKSIYKNSQIVK